MNDTTAAAASRYHELLSQTTPAQRVAICSRLIAASREMALAGIRREHPTASAAELKVRLAARLYGELVAQRVFASRPP